MSMSLTADVASGAKVTPFPFFFVLPFPPDDDERFSSGAHLYSIAILRGWILPSGGSFVVWPIYDDNVIIE